MHRQRTLLKTAKESGTHFLGLANKKNQEQRRLRLPSARRDFPSSSALKYGCVLGGDKLWSGKSSPYALWCGDAQCIRHTLVAVFGRRSMSLRRFSSTAEGRHSRKRLYLPAPIHKRILRIFSVDPQRLSFSDLRSKRVRQASGTFSLRGEVS